MTDPGASLSRADLDRLIARASTLDAEGQERVDLDQARSIAQDLGISESAWNAALAEREEVVRTVQARATARQLTLRTRLIAATGLVSGALSAAFMSQLGDGVLFLGGVAIAAGVALVVDGLRRRSMKRTQIELAAWWLSLTVGIMVGLGQLHFDPIAFTGVSWLGCASLLFSLRFRRRAPRPTPMAGSVTA